MRFLITFATNGQPLRLPIHYNRLIQGAIYASLDRITASFIHDRGFAYGKRNFKLFSFSRLIGEYSLDKQRGEIVFAKNPQLIVTSPSKEFCSSLINCILEDKRLVLGRTEVEVSGIQVMETVIPADGHAILRALSPVVIYSTMTRADGRKYTCYFQPGEEEFSKQIFENLGKKYAIIYGKPAPITAMSLRPLGQPRLNLVMYAGTVIKGYTCRLEVFCPGELLAVGLDAGFGAKNSQGFGCMEVESRKSLS